MLQKDCNYARLKGIFARVLTTCTILSIFSIPFLQRPCVSHRTYEVLEMEVYMYGPGHEDVFCHRHQDQLASGCWYFHRAGHGNSFRGGTYKGLGVTFGGGGHYSSLLLRSIRALTSNQDTIQGPCCVVDHILAVTGQPSIRAFLSSQGHGQKLLSAWDPSALFLRPCQPRSRPLHRTARVSLNYARRPPNTLLSRCYLSGEQVRFASVLGSILFLSVVESRISFSLSAFQVGLSLKKATPDTQHSSFVVAPYRYCIAVRIEILVSLLNELGEGREEGGENAANLS